uniref:Uncharacterized protein n=1 Tax=Ditylenchus dipsaci TaxID=166011 RepID=A0A915DHM1_9BILA
MRCKTNLQSIGLIKKKCSSNRLHSCRAIACCWLLLFVGTFKEIAQEHMSSVTPTKELKNVSVGSRTVKLCDVVVEISGPYLDSKLLNTTLHSSDGDKIRLKSFGSNTDRLLKNLQVGQTVEFSMLRAEKVFSTKYHDSVFAFELLFSDCSRFTVVKKPTAPEKISYLCDCHDSKRYEIELILSDKFEKCILGTSIDCYRPLKCIKAFPKGSGVLITATAKFVDECLQLHAASLRNFNRFRLQVLNAQLSLA